MSVVGVREFQPFLRPFGNDSVLYAPMNAAEAFGAGSLVFVNNDGELAQFPADGTEALLADADSGRIGGVACFGPNDGNDWRTGAAYATGAEIAFYPWDRGMLFKTRNLISAAGTDVVPTGAHVGESFQVTFDNVVAAALQGWSIETTAGVAGTDVIAKIVRVLDAELDPIAATDTTTGVWVVFELRTTL